MMCAERLPIVAVAIRYRDKVYSLPSPKRHHDVIRLIAEELGITYVDARDDDQGFLDTSGRFLSRKQALINALDHDQIKDVDQVRLGRLYSEDLW